MASRFSTRTTAAMLRLRARTLRAAPVPMAAMPLQMRFRARTLRARARATTRSPASRVCTPRRRVIFRVRIRWLVRLLITVVAVVRPSRPRPGAGPRLPWRSSGPRWSGRSASRPVGPQPSGSGRAAPRVPVRAAHAAASVGAKAAAITSRVAVHRATVPHVAAVAAVAAVPQAHSDVRAASPQRPVRTVWQSAMSMRS